MNEMITTKSFGQILPKTNAQTRSPYRHQKDAINCLNIIDKEPSYSTLVVLPTGGGKTYTISNWLLKSAINKNKKILWLAHRQMLLDQAAESFQKFAYSESLSNISSFSYKIISGSSRHERTIDINPTDDLLIISKDSIGRNLQRLDPWLNGEDTIYMVVDEAHHSTAKTYRKIINYVKSKINNLKLIGLTATPFRTAESEQGLLAKIYTDGINPNGKIIKNNIGITYQIGLKELINTQILAKPIFESCYTDESYGEVLGIEAWEHIQQLDIIPENIASEMAENAARNNLIINTYTKNKSRYGQTLVFAVNVIHAITLSKLFNSTGIKADFIVSDIKNSVTGINISKEDNEKKIARYRNGELQVLINVNILTEGVDLPQTKTVFLARPTVSTILMTQMIGRALRGTAAGGTKEAYIVSFIDQWNEYISWVNPESIFVGNNNDFEDIDTERKKRDIQLLSIAKIEEFAKILDDSLDTSAIEKVSFVKRIPLGMYAFTYLQENGMDSSYQIMVYDSTQKAYQDLMAALPDLFKSYKIDEEYLPNNLLYEMEQQCHDTFFCGEMIPAYEKKDVINILKYYAQYETTPQFYTFKDIDTNRLDATRIAKVIYDEDMGPRKKANYIDELWNNSDDNILKLFRKLQ